MTILLYDYRELQERPAKHLKVWKAWHIIMYIFAAVFGIANYVFLQTAMELTNHNCVLFPRQLEFHAVELPESQNVQEFNGEHESATNITDGAQSSVNGQNTTKSKRDAEDNVTLNNEATVDDNVTVFTENKTHRLVLDTSRSLFESGGDCIFAEYMPILSTVFAAVWITMFTMCPSGGHARSGLVEPWRILPPALLFALVMVGLTGHSFTLTNGGIHAFCEAFYELTNSTTCSAVDPFLALGWNKTWGWRGRTAATRAAGAGALASWSCAAALLLARCLAAPDFVIKRTSVYVTKDPQQKVTPHLKKNKSKSKQNSTNVGDNASIKSEPTITTELVTASVEQGEGDSAPTSLMVTPVKTSTPRQTENIEMTVKMQERAEALE